MSKCCRISLSAEELTHEIGTSFFIVLFLTLSCGASRGSSVGDIGLPTLNSSFSPLSGENQPALLARMTAAFDRDYERLMKKDPNRNLAGDFAFYYLRQELQALIDMWRATGKQVYLERARNVALKAIADARANPRPLMWHDRNRGKKPCFLVKSVEKITGGHNQVNDFKGAAGLMMVAAALRQSDPAAARQIADFVERDIVEKWLLYNPARTSSDFAGPHGRMYMLSTLNNVRSMRAHFATVCLFLHQLGYTRYPYLSWTQLIAGVYLSRRETIYQSSPFSGELGGYDPLDWGLIRKPETSGVIWYWSSGKKRSDLHVRDTSHGNASVWLAAEAYENHIVDYSVIQAMVNTLKNQIWDPAKGPFYFTNMVDGTDAVVQKLGPGRKGNLWFGWHRLAAYDPVLRDLFISISFDLTNGGHNMPAGAQNKSMPNGPLCFYAWAARLLSPQGNVRQFP